MSNFIINHSGDGKDIEELNFELVGLFDIGQLYKGMREDDISNFMLNGHPRVYKHKPNVVVGMVVSLSSEVDKNSRKHLPYGVFFATKEANPNSARPLLSNTHFTTYREKFKAIIFDPAWGSWKNILDLFHNNINPVDGAFKTVTTAKVIDNIDAKYGLNVFSGRAEVINDVLSFLQKLAETNMIRDVVIKNDDLIGEDNVLMLAPEKLFEFKTNANLDYLLSIASEIVDCHVVHETLRQCTIEENSFKREFPR